MDSESSVVVVHPARLRANELTDLELDVSFETPISRGAHCWVFADIRQDAGIWQVSDDNADNHVSATLEIGEEDRIACVSKCDKIRTLDLYPLVPEFLTACEISLPAASTSSALHVSVAKWYAPLRPIATFRFWIVIDVTGTLEFEPTGYKTYREFRLPNNVRPRYDWLASHTQSAACTVEGSYRNVPKASTRKTPELVWGELHGMALNQRPLDDFYEYAKRVTRLDFCAAVLFSYNTCLGDVWDQVKAAAKRHLSRGSFVPVAAFECGTPEDDSHRVAYFFDPSDVPPIFCETRPPALDPVLALRFHPDSVRCETLDAFYATVHRYGGFVGGHFHTLTYREEILAELWQKQEFADKYQRGKHASDEDRNFICSSAASIATLRLRRTPFAFGCEKLAIVRYRSRRR